MAIEDWSEDISLPQNGEVLREWLYLEQFYPFNGGLKDYAELLDYAFTKQTSPNPPPSIPEFDKYLEEHPVQFYRDDIKNGKAPLYDTIRSWSKGRNCKADIKHTWIARRTAFRKRVKILTMENLAAEYNRDLPWLYQTNKQSIIDTEYAVKSSKAQNKFTPNQAEAAANAKAKSTTTMKDIVEVEDAPFKADVNLVTEVKTDLGTDLERIQEQILSPAFAEVTRKLSTHLKEDSQ